MAGGQMPGNANVADSSTEIVPGNDSRQWAVVVNDSDTDIYAALDADAVLHKGIRLNANGGSMVVSKDGDIFSNGPINGIHGGSGTKVICYQEGE